MPYGVGRVVGRGTHLAIASVPTSLVQVSAYVPHYSTSTIVVVECLCEDYMDA